MITVNHYTTTEHIGLILAALRHGRRLGDITSRPARGALWETGACRFPLVTQRSPSHARLSKLSANSPRPVLLLARSANQWCFADENVNENDKVTPLLTDNECVECINDDNNNPNTCSSRYVNNQVWSRDFQRRLRRWISTFSCLSA